MIRKNFFCPSSARRLYDWLSSREGTGEMSGEKRKVQSFGNTNIEMYDRSFQCIFFLCPFFVRFSVTYMAKMH